MPEEYLDIVNEQDEVIGKDTRKNVHDNHRIHRGVHVIVVNSRGEILIQKRSKAKDYYPGYFDMSVGAQVQSGESYEESAIRELYEELGCSTSELNYIGDYDAYSERQREKRRLFIHICEGPFSPSSDEIESIAFMSIDDIARAMENEPFTEGFKNSFKIYVDSIRKL